MWSICGYELQPGEKKQVQVEPDISGYEMPTTLICGKYSGKTFLITAQIHSGKYPATLAVIRAAKKIEPNKLNRNLILVHCVNTSGFWARSEGRVPKDGSNLNGCYPRDPNGTTGMKVADFFVKSIFPYVDFVLDMHSGDPQEPLAPCLFYPVHQEVQAV